MVFKADGRMRHGHVAVVSQVLTDRIIQITHANWSHGKVEENVTAVDVSPKGDWSQVKVWYDPSHSMGSKTYPTYGFIYQDAAAPISTPATALAQGAAVETAAYR